MNTVTALVSQSGGMRRLRRARRRRRGERRRCVVTPACRTARLSDVFPSAVVSVLGNVRLDVQVERIGDVAERPGDVLVTVRRVEPEPLGSRRSERAQEGRDDAGVVVPGESYLAVRGVERDASECAEVEARVAVDAERRRLEFVARAVLVPVRERPPGKQSGNVAGAVASSSSRPWSGT
jgi:hypothetical protein